MNIKEITYTLRLLEEDDLTTDHVMAMLNDPEVNQFLARSLPVSKSDERNWISSVNSSQSEVVYGIFVNENEKEILIGTCGIHKIDWISRKAEAGIAIFHKKYWEQRIGTSVVRDMLDFAFNTLNLERIYTSALSFNVRSIAMQKRIGFKEEGIRRNSFYKNGEMHDEIMLGLLREEYYAQKS
jgi:RimJ/RimL family protein N-acetyltransferase